MTFTPFSLPTDPNSQILIDTTLCTQVQGASIPLATIDPQNRPGWYYGSNLQTDSLIWTVFNGVDQNFTLGNVQNLTFTATHDNTPTNKCYMAITSPFSRIVYENNNVDLIPGEKCLFYTNIIPPNPNQLRLVQLDLVTKIGPCSPVEQLMSITLEGTNATLFPDSLQVCIENIGYQLDPDTIPIVVNLSTYDLDIYTLNTTLGITNTDLVTLNATMVTNNTNLTTNSTALDTNGDKLATNSTALDTNSDNLATNSNSLDTLNTTLQGGINTKYPAVNYDAFGRFRVSNPFTLFDSNFRYNDNGLWATSSATGGSTSFNANQGLMELSVDGTTNSQVIRETYRVFSYQPGKSLLVFNSFAGTPSHGIRQRIGYFGEQNGIFFQINGDQECSFVKRTHINGTTDDISVLQSVWNGDKLNGTGASGYTLNLSKPQLMWTDFEWLGVGTVRCGFVINEQFILCHSFNWANDANSTASTYMTTASLPCRYEITNIGGSTLGTFTLKQICTTVISEGGYELAGTQLSVATALTAPVATGTTPVPIISLRLTSGKLDAVVIMTAMNIVPAGSATTSYYWQIIRGGTTTGGNWIIPAFTGSSIDYNVFPTAGTITGGICMASGFFSASNQSKGGIDLLKEAVFKFQLLRNGLTTTPIELTIVCSSITGTNASVFASIDWEEVTR